MVSGDGLIVRVRPFYGRLSSEQAMGVSRLSKKYGNGVIDLSSRANLQIRGVKPESHLVLLDELAVLNLLDETVESESRRNIIMSPFWCANDSNVHIYDELRHALSLQNTPELPVKFGFAIDCGNRPVLKNVSADIRFERGVDGELICCADGAALGVSVTLDNAVDTAMKIAEWFLSTNGAPKGRGRMAKHLKTKLLPDKFQKIERQVVSKTQKPSPTDIGYMVAFKFGQIEAGTLADLSNLGSLRMTPWRMILIEGHFEKPDIPSVITVPDHPLLSISACTGAPACPQAKSGTRDFALSLSSLISAKKNIHISGCTKGCAHPNVADVTLVACDKDRFNLIKYGLASDMPIISGLEIKEILTDPSPLTEKF